MYSPKEQEKIFGDVNIAKYLADKLTADLYSSRDIQTRKEIDKWIEVANKVSCPQYILCFGVQHLIET